MSVSFTGLNSNIDSQSLIQQLVQIETNSKVTPLQTKKSNLTTERTSVNSLRSQLNSLKNSLNISSITGDPTLLVSNSASVSDKDKASASVSGRASAQSFQLNITKLATQSKVKSASYLDTGVTTSTKLSDVNFKNSLEFGTVTINGQTASLPSLVDTSTVRKSATQISNNLVLSDPISKANLKDVASIADGTVTINGTSANVSGLTDMQSVVDFFTNNFSGVGASLVNGSLQLSGITSLGDSSDTSDILSAFGLKDAVINSGTATGAQNLSIPRSSDTLASLGVTGSVITVNGIDVSFDPNTDTLSSLVTSINANTGLSVTSSFDSSSGKFSLTNDVTGATPISVTSVDSNIASVFDLTDETLGNNTSFQQILDFLNSNFSGVSASFSGGKVTLSGVSSMGSAGDTSNLLSALGLSNAKINSGSVTGIQNLSSPKKTDLLSSVGVTGTSFKINGAEITFDPNVTTIDSLVQSINNSSAKVKASYDSLNGTLALVNTATGSLTIPLSSDNSNILNVFSLTDATLGDNAEFSISTQNNGETLVSNTNSVSGIIPGLTLDLKQVTTTPITVTVSEDSTSYKSKLDDVLKQINSTLSFARTMKNKVGQRFDAAVKALFGKTFDSNDTNRYKSLVDIGLKSNLNIVDNKFSGYELGSGFSDALAKDPAAVNKLLYGKKDSKIGPFDDNSSGILVQLDDLLNTYVNSTNGVFQALNTNYDSQSKSLDSNITRAQNSVDAYEKRLKSQFTQLDVVNAQMKQQQSALASLP